MKDKNDTIRRELKDINYLNRLYRRMKPADLDQVAKDIQGAEVIAAEATGEPGSEETDGFIIYLQLQTGERLAVSLAATPGHTRPIIDTMTAKIYTK